MVFAALPKLRWLLVGAVGVGIWVLDRDSKVSRPPERVPGVSRSVSLPANAIKPPPKPSAMVTGSIAEPVRALQTTTRLRMRAQADDKAAVVATLEAGTVVSQIVRSGRWRLVSADGRKGWVSADYLAPAPPRPKAAVPGKTAAEAAGKPVKTP